MDPKKDPELYIKSLEDRLKIRSDELEEIHMEAAIDAQLSATTRTELSHAKPIIANDIQESKNLFDDYVNPYSVTNCFSPYMPTIASKISSFVQFVGLTENDVLLDIGCGDGRVCIGASMISGCQSIGLDISPPCIAMAQEVAQEEGISDRCHFFETDATIDPKSLLEETSPLANMLCACTVVFLYTYPTLLRKLVPLLAQLTSRGNVRAIITLTYHLTESEAAPITVDNESDFKLYTMVQLP